MIVKGLALASCVFLTACAPRMSYEEVQETSKYCTDRSLEPFAYKDVGGGVYKVRCLSSDGAVYKPQ